MMDLTGRFMDISRDYATKKPMVRFLINEEPNGIEDLSDKDLKIIVKKQTKPRSLDANAYFHVLCDRLREKLNMSMARCKNMLITSYGQIEYLDDGIPLCYKTNAPIDYILEQEQPHLKFKKMSDDLAYMYVVYRGSHTYDSKEMHQLLEGTILECQMQGIETRTPDEIRRMEMLWDVKQRMKGEGYE